MDFEPKKKFGDVHPFELTEIMIGIVCIFPFLAFERLNNSY